MKKKPEKAVSELSKTVREFFANLLKIKYQFTYDELNGELFNHNLDWKFRAQIDKFFKKLTEMEFSGREINQHEMDLLAREAETIIKRMSGYMEEKPKSRSASWANRGIFGKLKKLTGLNAKITRPGESHVQEPEPQEPPKPEPEEPVNQEPGETKRPERVTAKAIAKEQLTERRGTEPPPPPPPTQSKESGIGAGIENVPAAPKPPKEPAHAPKPDATPLPKEKHRLSVDGILRNVNEFSGKAVRLKGKIHFVNKIMEKGDFWYMLNDGTGDIVAVSKATDKYNGIGMVKGTVKKTLTGDAFIEIADFKLLKQVE